MASVSFRIPVLLRTVALALPLVAAPAAAGTQVHKIWGPLLPADGGVWVEAAPRTDGSALAATGNAVSQIDRQGALTPLGQGESALLNPGSESYALRHGGGYDIYDAAGQPLGAYPGSGSALQPYEIVKLIPGTELLYAPAMQPREELGVVDSARIFDAGLHLIGDFPAPGLEISRFAADRIVYTQPRALVARRLAGTLLWQAEIDVHKFETAADRSIVVPRYVKGQVLHYLQGKRVAAQAVDGVVWNLAIAPSGHYSAATTRTVLYLFEDGHLVSSVPLRVGAISSLAVSDRGEALVGTQPAATTTGAPGGAEIFLYDLQGQLLWRETLGVDRNGYRPLVHFAPGGDGFAVIEKRGLSTYTIERSQP
jgi:hypothetical protein